MHHIPSINILQLSISILYTSGTVYCGAAFSFFKRIINNLMSCGTTIIRGLILAIAVAGLAAAAPNPARAEMQTISACAALDDPETYKEEDNKEFAQIIPGKDGWIFRSRLDLKYRFKITDQTKDSYHRLVSAFRYKGSDMVMVMIPTRGITSRDMLLPPHSENYKYDKALKNYYAMMEEMRHSGFTVADMTGVEQVKNFFFKDDNHWTVDAARFTAAKTAEAIKDLRVYNSLKKTAFQTIEYDEPNTPPHRYLDFINTVCGTAYKGERNEKSYRTVMKDSAST